MYQSDWGSPHLKLSKQMSGLLVVRVKGTPVLLRRSSLPECSGGWFGVGRIALWSCNIFSLVIQESGCQQKQEQGNATCCSYFPAPGGCMWPSPSCIPPVYHALLFPFPCCLTGQCCLWQQVVWRYSLATSLHCSHASVSVSPMEQAGAGMEQEKQRSSGLCRCCHRAVEQGPVKLA